ncbi:MAG: nucleotide exchange factor GrpE [Bacilli bacterium]|nr:nucleotide exchange factor GrpE [Bacilli bacterium]
MSEDEKDLKATPESETKESAASAKSAEPHKKKEKKKPSIEDKLELIETELKDIKDKYLRTLAEMENLKKRTSEETKRERKYASMPIADKLIDQLEVFDQALGVKTEDKNLQNFLIGFKMIKDMLYQSLESEGVKVIDTPVGKKFDPTVEHAFDHRYESDKPLDTILEVVKKGYMFKDRLLRAALVIINVKPEEETKAEPETEPQNENIDSNVA